MGVGVGLLSAVRETSVTLVSFGWPEVSGPAEITTLSGPLGAMPPMEYVLVQVAYPATVIVGLEDVSGVRGWPLTSRSRLTGSSGPSGAETGD